MSRVSPYQFGIRSNSDKITNAAITLELFDGYTVEMRQLTIKQTADLDAYVRGKFIKNTLDAIEDLDAAMPDNHCVFQFGSGIGIGGCHAADSFRHIDFLFSIDIQ